MAVYRRVAMAVANNDFESLSRVREVVILKGGPEIRNREMYVSSVGYFRQKPDGRPWGV
jgi:hypothetical protein